MKPKRIILDTDIGTDVDDCLALALILNSPELDLVAVTTVYGDTVLRARMVLKLLALRGVGGIPVAAGAEKPLLGSRPVYWAGYEGRGLLGPEDAALHPVDEGAVALMARTVIANPGQITLVTIGPLTNAALALQSEPGLARCLAGLVMMGGVTGGHECRHLPRAEHNFRSDPEAVRVVLAAGVPTTIVPLDVTTRVRIDAGGLAMIRARDDAFHRAVAEQVERYPRFAEQGWTNLHDPLAVAALIDPTLLHFEPVKADVEVQGEKTGELLSSSPRPGEPATACIALDVEVERSERLILGRLA